MFLRLMLMKYSKSKTRYLPVAPFRGFAIAMTYRANPPHFPRQTARHYPWVSPVQNFKADGHHTAPASEGGIVSYGGFEGWIPVVWNLDSLNPPFSWLLLKPDDFPPQRC